MLWPTGLQGSANFHERFRYPPSAAAVLADGHAKRFTNIAGEGGRGPRFRIVPDNDWLP